ncbi:TIGR03885 family FMN-dependent LLM class oxidoreductase [Chitinophaga horti]|uniref:TIGR03885 family FMN-dependent LLM class oxidoreductase n=1 Tax=Chitinophaga horti TaxID=2920382 RepID=A0ABY6J747_9BACT|nr:TIGR03885 family FMN-dependent LLM class oxidoreductase [Chitinophaga horti]UYQ95496.1 TIGR03885 family FMN-dependent LLM class oxidoreductase [Chitinophaga horti]
MNVGYHISHEQHTPSALLRYAMRADLAGFTAALSSDHFHPWNGAQGQSGFAWSWLGAALQATGLSYGIVNAPGQRYHPAIIAQACATLAEMYPDRFWVALGSGQAMNEAITGQGWPAKAERNARLEECVAIIRALWNGETVSHHGLVTVSEAKLYTLPKRSPMIAGAAITPETAGWVATWADALITVSQPLPALKKVVEAFRKNGGEGKQMILKIQLSYHPDIKIARQDAYEQWRSNIFGSALLSELRSVAQFEQAGMFVRPEDLDPFVHISSSTQEHLDRLSQYAELGFDTVILHNVNTHQEVFIDDFGQQVLPLLKPQ